MRVPAWYRAFDDWTKRVMERIDLKKKLPPGYVHKWVFRGAVFAAILLFFFALASNGWKLTTDPYLCCADDIFPPTYCINSFNMCRDDPFGAALIGVGCPNVMDLCAEHPVICERETLAPGECVGTPPSKLVQTAAGDIIGIFLFSFVVNHLLWFLRRKIKS